MINILIVDDHQLARTGIAAVIAANPDMTVVGQGHDGAEGVRLHRELKPDVTIMDLRMPDVDGVKAIELIRATTPAAKILVLSHYDGDENVFRALRAGASGYLLKDASGNDLTDAIRTVARGANYLPRPITEQLARRALSEPLTARELQVLTEVAKGHSNREIAQALSLTEKTATVYVSNIIAKLGAKSRTDAVAVGLKRGLILPPR